MGLLCRIRGHKIGTEGVFNEGYYFARCECCPADLIKTSAHWRVAPSGYKVAWRSGVHRHAIPSDFRRNLPSAPRRARSLWLGLHRRSNGAMLMPGPKVEEHADVAEARADGATSLVVLGLFAFFGFASRLPQRG